MQDAAGNQLPGHRRGVQPLPPEAARHPDAAAQLPELRHAVHGLAEHAAEHVGDLHRGELRIDRADLPCDGPDHPLRPGRRAADPCGLGAGPHQPIAVDDAIVRDAAAVADRSLKRDHIGQPLAQRCGDRGPAPHRQQRVGQPLQRRAEMHAASQHDMGGPQLALRRGDPLSDAGQIKADHRRCLENARAGLLGERREAMHVAAAIDLECLGIMDGVEITRRSQNPAHTIGLPALDIGSEIFAKGLQPADQLVAAVHRRDLQRAFGEGDAGHVVIGHGGADIVGAVLRQRPQLTGVLEADTRNQIGDWIGETRHHGAEHMA